MKPVYYSEYLQLDKILNAQEPESAKAGVRADDEMLFVIIHQVYELWFKQIMHEVGIVLEIFSQPSINDKGTDISRAVSKLNRVTKIQQVLLSQLDVLETMTPLDFLDFRDYLRPASGFQSIQFKILEATLGLPFDKRFGQAYYLSQLTPQDVERVKEAERKVPLIDLINTWLERMPFLQNEAGKKFWNDYRSIYEKNLSEGEKNNLSAFDNMFVDAEKYPTNRKLSMESNKNALFIMLYRDYPIFQAPYQLINCLLDIDELLAQWRYRHMNMVQRMIGRRIGTGGSTGADYLKAAADTHYIFKEFADLTTFLMQRSKLPELSKSTLESFYTH